MSDLLHNHACQFLLFNIRQKNNGLKPILFHHRLHKMRPSDRPDFAACSRPLQIAREIYCASESRVAEKKKSLLDPSRRLPPYRTWQAPLLQFPDLLLFHRPLSIIAAFCDQDGSVSSLRNVRVCRNRSVAFNAAKEGHFLSANADPVFSRPASPTKRRELIRFRNSFLSCRALAPDLSRLGRHCVKLGGLLLRLPLPSRLMFVCA